MLWAVLNKFSKQHFTKKQVYCHLAPISQTIQVRQARHGCRRTNSRDIIQWAATQTQQCWLTSKYLSSSTLSRHWMPSRGLTNLFCWHTLMKIAIWCYSFLAAVRNNTPTIKRLEAKEVENEFLELSCHSRHHHHHQACEVSKGDNYCILTKAKFYQIGWDNKWIWQFQERNF